MTSEDKKMVSYDPGEHRVKHCWSRPDAEFVSIGSGFIGKCPSTLTKLKAKELLNDAEFEGKNLGLVLSDLMPDRVWNVHEGVIYEAVPSGSGSYHGYPWRGRPGRNRLAREVKKALFEKAKMQDYEKEYLDWLSKYEA